MSTVGRLLMWSSIIWIAPLLYFQMKNEAKFKKNILLGVTMPKIALEDEEIQAIIKKYQKVEAIVMFGLLALAAVFFVAYKDIKSLMNSWCLWTDFCIVAPMVPFVTAFKKLKRIKADRGWVKEKNEEKLYVDTKAIPELKKVSPWIFVICTAACMLPVLWAKDGIFLCVCFALTEITYGLCCRFGYRNKAELVDENTELTIALTQIRKYNWNKIWVIFAVLTAVLDMLLSFSLKHAFLSILIITVWTIVIGAIAFKVEFKVRKIQEKLTEDCGLDGEYIDDDDHWIAGLIYFNPNDSKLLINNRTGVGTTFNMSRPFGRFITILVVVILVLMPFSGTMVSFIGNADIVMEYKEDALIIDYGSKQYLKVYAEDIRSIELVNDLPSNLSRTWGTAADHLLQGNFTSDIGALNLCLDPECPPFILLTKKSGNKVLFGGRTVEETQMIFDILSNEVQ